MRRPSIWVLTVVLGCAPAAMAQTGSKAATEKALIANEQAVNDAIVKGDVKAFSALVASDGWSTDAGGFMSVADFIKAFDQAKITEAHLTGSKVMWIDDKSAVLTYTWTGKGTFMNQPVPNKTYSSTVWTERGGKWVAVYHQESAAAPPPAAKKPAKK